MNMTIRVMPHDMALVFAQDQQTKFCWRFHILTVHQLVEKHIYQSFDGWATGAARSKFINIQVSVFSSAEQEGRRFTIGTGMHNITRSTATSLTV